MLQFLRDLWARHNVAPPPGPQFRDKSPDQQFAEGRVAITMRHSIQLRFMRKIDGFEWDVAPMPWFQAPGGQRARKAGLEMEFFALTAGGQAPDQAWAVTKFLTGKENVGWSSEAGFGIPAIKGLAESKAFLDPAKPPARAKALPGRLRLRRLALLAPPGHKRAGRRRGAGPGPNSWPRTPRSPPKRPWTAWPSSWRRSWTSSGAAPANS